MTHSAHILVPSEEEAKAILDRLAAGEEFEQLAAELSTDDANAYKGGDLGWHGPGDMEQAFEDAELNTPVGEISDPVQTQFGWHIIKVYARTDVPMTPSEQDRQRQEKFREMLTSWREEGNIVIHDFWMEHLPSLLQETPSPQLP